MTSPNTVLYYPGYHMQTSWLKAALLYWDGIARIVPNEISEHVDDYLRDFQMLADHKAVLNLPPDAYVDEAAKKFDDYLVPLFEWDAETTYDAKHLKEILANYINIHPAKLKPMLQRDLREFSARSRQDGYLAVPSHVGGPYMMCLGSVMSDRTGFPLVTDNRDFEAMGEYLSFGTGQKAVDDEPHYKALLHLGIRLPSPRDLENVSLESLLKFRKKREGERVEMRDAVSKLMEAASKIEDSNSVGDFWEGHSRRVGQALKTYRDTMADIGLMDAGTLLTIGVPTGVASAIAAVGGWINPVVAGILSATALSVCAAGWWGQRRFRRRAASQECPWHYTLLMEKEIEW
jgi:hypothetical protein